MRGVIHVGAHRGEELPRYLADKRRPIIMFEPQTLGWEPPRGVFVMQCALGEANEELPLSIPLHLPPDKSLDTQSASLLELNPERAIEIGWTPTDALRKIVPVRRFDKLIIASCAKDCELLVIDVQGMELQVLRGFGEWLNCFSRIIVECSSPPVYEGGADTREVIEYLKGFGFSPISNIIPRHGDVEFRKEAQ